MQPKRNDAMPNKDVVIREWYRHFLETIGYNAENTQQQNKAALASVRICKFDGEEMTTSLPFVPVDFSDVDDKILLDTINFEKYRSYKVNLPAGDGYGVDEYESRKTKRFIATVKSKSELETIIKMADKDDFLPYYQSRFKPQIDSKIEKYKASVNAEASENANDTLSLIKQNEKRNQLLYNELRVYNPDDIDDMVQITRIFDAIKNGELYRMDTNGDYSYRKRLKLNLQIGATIDETPIVDTFEEMPDDETKAELLYFAGISANPDCHKDGIIDDGIYLADTIDRINKQNHTSASSKSGFEVFDHWISDIEKKASAVQQLEHSFEPTQELKLKSVKQAEIPVDDAYQLTARDKELCKIHGEGFDLKQKAAENGLSVPDFVRCIAATKKEISALYKDVTDKQISTDFADIRDGLEEDFAACINIANRLGFSQATTNKLLDFHIDPEALLDLEAKGMAQPNGVETKQTPEQMRELIEGENGILKSILLITPEDVSALDELGMEKSDLINMSLRKRMPIDAVMKNIRNELSAADAELDNAYEDRKKSVASNYNINVVEESIRENFENIHDCSGQRGVLGTLREEYAKLVNNMAIRDKLRCGGKVLNERETKKAEALLNDDRSWKKLMDSSQFNAYFERCGMQEIQKLMNATSQEDVEQVYANFRAGVLDKSIDNVTNRLERVTSKLGISDRDEYFTNAEVLPNGRWRNDLKNPFGFSIDRTAVSTIAFCELIQGSSTKQVREYINPFSKTEEKLECGKSALKRVDDTTLKNACDTRALLANGFEKCLACGDEIIAGMDKFDLKTLTSERCSDLIRLGGRLMDINQEYEKAAKINAIEPDKGLESVLLTNDATVRSKMKSNQKCLAGINSVTRCLSPFVNGLNELKNGTLNPSEVRKFILNDALTFGMLGDMVNEMKNLPKSRNKPFSQICMDYPGVTASATLVADVSSKLSNVPSIDECTAFYSKPSNQKKLAENIISGKFYKDLGMSAKVQNGVFAFNIKNPDKAFTDLVNQNVKSV